MAKPPHIALTRSYDAELFRQVGEELKADPDGLLAAGVLYKRGSRGHSAMVRLAGNSFFLKKYYAKGGIHRLVDLFRRSRGLKAWHVNVQLFEAGVAVPRPLIYLEERRYGLWANGYLLMEFIDGLGDLRKVWQGATAAERDLLVHRVADEIARIHGNLFIHGDLKWYNILCRRSLRGYDVVLSDLDGARRAGPLSRSAMAKDLERFLADFDEVEDGQHGRALFLRLYRAQTG